jgi:hypothetical protein
MVNKLHNFTLIILLVTSNSFCFLLFHRALKIIKIIIKEHTIHFHNYTAKYSFEGKKGKKNNVKNTNLIHNCVRKFMSKGIEWKKMLLKLHNRFLSHLEAPLFLTEESGSCSSTELFSPS